MSVRPPVSVFKGKKFKKKVRGINRLASTNNVKEWQPPDI